MNELCSNFRVVFSCSKSIFELGIASITTSDMAGDLSKWPIFSLLDEQFRRSIKWAVVFGSCGDESIIMLRDGQVLSHGTNSSSCLGLGTSSSYLHPRKIDSLSEIELMTIAFGGGPHVLALTDAGEVFAWGHNAYGQLGLGVTTPCSPTPLLITHNFSPDLKVVGVACGGSHSLAMTSNGTVFAWGLNSSGQLGTGDTVIRSFPTRVAGLLEETRSVQVCCGHASSYALSNIGEVYGWGQNGSGQLGVNCTTNKTLPEKAQFHDTPIKQLATGHSHVLALTITDQIYSWGGNIYGQLGNGSRQLSIVPDLIAHLIGSVSQVAACHPSHLSVAALSNGLVFMWGQCHGQNVLTPVKTNFTNVDDVFACFSCPPCSYRPIISAEGCSSSPSVSTCIESKFDDPETGDLKLVVEGRSIYVHKAILRMRSEYFKSMLHDGRWKETQTNVIELKNHSYQIYHAFIKYLYTDRVELNSSALVELLMLCDSICQGDLKSLCEQLLCKEINLENIGLLYCTALKHKAKKLEEVCLQFTLRHSTAVILSESFSQLDDFTARNLIAQLADNGALKT